MSGRVLLLAGLAYVFLVAGLVLTSGPLVVLMIPLAAYLALALLWSPEKLDLEVTRSLSLPHVSPGVPVTVRVAIANRSAHEHELLVEDTVPAGLEVEGDFNGLTILSPGETLDLAYIVRGGRGSYDFERFSVAVSDPFGLFYRWTELTVRGRFLIKPRVERLPPLPVRPLRTHGFTGPILARRSGMGVGFFSLREYQPGDPLRRINWRATARHERAFYTNTFEQERVTDVNLILDARQQLDVVMGGDSLFEHAVHATAALADAFLGQGHRVGLLVYGRGQEATFPGYGKVQREKILRALAASQTGDNFALETLSYLPTRFFPARSQVVLLSPLMRDDVNVLVRLRATGYEVLVVSPDPVAFASKGEDFTLPVRLARIERKLLLRRLQRLGVVVVDWQVDRPVRQVLQVARVLLAHRQRSARISL